MTENGIDDCHAWEPSLGGTVLASDLLNTRHDLRIQTTDEGLECSEVDIKVAGFRIPAYVARPALTPCRGIAVVVHDAFGPHAQLQDICRRLAHLDYLAILPSLFAREAPLAASTVSAWVDMAKQIPDARVLEDLAEVARWAQQFLNSPAPVSMMGFCWGGRIAWLAAAKMPLAAAVSWYGYLRNYTSLVGQQEPIDVAASFQAPVLGLYGGSDEVIPHADIEAMQLQIASGVSGSRLQVFDGAGHAFFSDHRAEYHSSSAKLAWARACAWLDGTYNMRVATQ